jgi:hypothetical protein
LLISLAHTREPLFVVNRPASAPSHQGAAPWVDRAIELVQPHFDQVWLRGDTDFALTTNFDRWDAQSVKFIFGYDARQGLIERAERLPPDAWTPLVRPPKYEVKTSCRTKPENVKQQLIEKRGYKHIELVGEEVASFSYRPVQCTKSYRIVALKKHLRLTKAGQVIGQEIRYFFYITNDWAKSDDSLIAFIRQRCDQENTVEQLKNGVPAFHAPANTLHANWAYMVIASLAWSLKAWYGLLLDDPILKLQIVRMEFKQFLQTFLLIPCQILTQGRRLIYRIVHFTLDTLDVFNVFQHLQKLCFP